MPYLLLLSAKVDANLLLRCKYAEILEIINFLTCSRYNHTGKRIFAPNKRQFSSSGNSISVTCNGCITFKALGYCHPREVKQLVVSNLKFIIFIYIYFLLFDQMGMKFSLSQLFPFHLVACKTVGLITIHSL